MPAYILRLDDSDGNDNTVYAVIVEAPSAAAALDKAWSFVKAKYPDDDKDGWYGTFHPCDCECEHGFSAADAAGHEGATKDCDPSMWECAHGGVLLGEDVEEYATVEEAFAARARYHSLIDLIDLTGDSTSDTAPARG